MKPVAIIPARGGSKRIPRKNIKTFCGKPMIGYSISAALKSELFGEVIVSTDDDEIAVLAKELGASVPFKRPADVSDDHTPLAGVLLHALEELKRQRGELPDFFCCLLATAPFVQVSDLKRGWEIIRQRQSTSVLPVASFPFPIFRALKKEESDFASMVWPEHELTRSNDLPETFHDAGQFYWLQTAAFLAEQKVYTKKMQSMVLPRWRVQDIDTVEDWERAEVIFKSLMAPLSQGEKV
jgi:pseudaminic acid cytidylyltransferase